MRSGAGGFHGETGGHQIATSNTVHKSRVWNWLNCWAFLGSFFYIVKLMLAFSLSFLLKDLHLLREKETPLSASVITMNEAIQGRVVFLKAELTLAKKLLILSSLLNSRPFPQLKRINLLTEETMASSNSVIPSFQEPE